MRTNRLLALAAVTAIGAITCLSAFPGTASAQALALRKHRGQIIVSEEPIAIVANDKAMAAAIKKQSKTTITKGRGGWNMNILAVLTKNTAAPDAQLGIYDVTKGRTYVSYKDLNVDPESTVVLAEIQLTEEDGIKPGNKYELVVIRSVNGKDTIYARTKLTFK